MAGKKKKTRSEVFADYFANSAWRSADEAKRLRTRSRAAASTCKEVLGITNHLNDGDRAIIAEDITALKRAFEILDQMGNAFELAQRTAKQAEVKRDSDRLQAEEARLDDMVVELFGKNPKKLEVVSFSVDLAEFEHQINDFCKANRNTPRGLIDTFGNTGLVRDLTHHAKSKDTAELARLAAKAWIDISPKGHPYQGTGDHVTWFAGKDDFYAWRAWKREIDDRLKSISGSA